MNSAFNFEITFQLLTVEPVLLELELKGVDFFPGRLVRFDVEAREVVVGQSLCHGDPLLGVKSE